MSHLSFVLISYGAAALVLGGVIVWLWLSARSTKGELARLEAQGIKRRSEA
ncbi:MAG: heme exporter protein CcmD [Pseudomonadota bacterium]